MAFGLFKKAPASSHVTWRRRLTAHGVLIGRSEDGVHLSSDLLPAYIAQLIDDGFASQERVEEVVLPWASAYEALSSPGYDELSAVLELPPFTACDLVLESRNSLTDEDFSIAVSGWRSAEKSGEQPQVVGAMLVRDEQTELMRPEQWALFSEVVGFSRRPPAQRSERLHREAWGRIRTLALKAGARLDDFLRRSVALTPERLDIGLRKSAPIADDSVIEIQPTFEGAPPYWL